jgi:formiminotetrahydrofolate cyclodeaminase
MTSALASSTLSALLASLAAKSPTPGGGASAAVAGALAAAQAQMVVAYSLGKKSLAAHQEANQRAEHVLENARGLLLRLADEDAAAYGMVNELGKLPESDPRRGELGAAQAASIQVPLSVAAACVDILRLMEKLAATTNRQLRSDLAIAAVFADAAARASRWNVAVNVPGPDHPAIVAAQGLAAEASRLCAAVSAACA